MSVAICITCGELVLECRCSGHDCPECGMAGTKEEPCVCPTTGPVGPEYDKYDYSEDLKARLED